MPHLTVSPEGIIIYAIKPICFHPYIVAEGKNVTFQRYWFRLDLF